jgi:hypothetical protein
VPAQLPDALRTHWAVPSEHRSVAVWQRWGVGGRLTALVRER